MPRGDRALRVLAVLTVLLVAGGIALWVTVIHDRPLPTYGPSMRPTLESRVDLDIDTEAYDAGTPAIGDIVAAQAPAGLNSQACASPRPRSPCGEAVEGYSEQRVIKRVVALPGQTVAFAGNGSLIRNGHGVQEPYIRPCRRQCRLPRPIEVPPGHYFLAGDNRPVSSDSRTWGPVSLDAIDGRVNLDE